MLHFRHLMIAFFATIVALSSDAAWACPMCKAAAEADPKLPTAFMASILFMLAMPFTLLTCYGVGFYRLSKKAQMSPTHSVNPHDEVAE
jgi:hypothetical protein